MNKCDLDEGFLAKFFGIELTETFFWSRYAVAVASFNKNVKHEYTFLGTLTAFLKNKYSYVSCLFVCGLFYKIIV